MGLFGGNCGCGHTRNMDCCEIIFLLYILSMCGCGGGFNFDCNTLIILLLLLTCGCGGGNHDCR